MSYIVLHMDKFKKEAVRGIQSHNNRERESHSNPDIDYERSSHNYDLHEPAAENYAEAIQNRIDDLLLVKAVRKDAVHMCGLIVSSDSAFFEKLSPEDTKRFFEESKAFLTEFVGAENVISAMVHMDEKTPHMHFLHVPVTPEKPPTLAKYLNEFRRGKDKKKDTPPPPTKTAPAPKADMTATVNRGGFVITPDTPLDEL